MTTENLPLEKPDETYVSRNAERQNEREWKILAMCDNFKSGQLSELEPIGSDSAQAESADSSKKLKFIMIYLGSKRLSDKNVNLFTLQDPLKDIYFRHSQYNLKDEINVLSISENGLNVKNSLKERLNPFSSIAAWAAVKIVFRQQAQGVVQYAFVPLATNSNGVRQSKLFRKTEQEQNSVTMNWKDEDSEKIGTSAIFTIVMKNPNNSKQLDCHGFVCKSPDDAILMAANLYDALLAKLKNKRLQQIVKKRGDTSKKRGGVTVRNRNSIKGQTNLREILSETSDEANPTSSTAVVDEGPDSAPEKDLNTSGQSQDTSSIPPAVPDPEEDTTPPRCSPDCWPTPGDATTDDGRERDITTDDDRMTISTGRDFLYAKGRERDQVNSEMVSQRGLAELFNEFQGTEGLKSMDDILNLIIDANGMSFNDLRPLYKEFLLKLAFTLTKDELYQRSKAIMRRQKKMRDTCQVRTSLRLLTSGFENMYKKSSATLKTKCTKFKYMGVIFQSDKRISIKASNLSKVKRRTSQAAKRQTRHPRHITIKKDELSTGTTKAILQPPLNEVPCFRVTKGLCTTSGSCNYCKKCCCMLRLQHSGRKFGKRAVPIECDRNETRLSCTCTCTSGNGSSSGTCDFMSNLNRRYQKKNESLNNVPDQYLRNFCSNCSPNHQKPHKKQAENSRLERAIPLQPETFSVRTDTFNDTSTVENSSNPLRIACNGRRNEYELRTPRRTCRNRRRSHQADMSRVRAEHGTDHGRSFLISRGQKSLDGCFVENNSGLVLNLLERKSLGEYRGTPTQSLEFDQVRQKPIEHRIISRTGPLLFNTARQNRDMVTNNNFQFPDVNSISSPFGFTKRMDVYSSCTVNSFYSHQYGRAEKTNEGGINTILHHHTHKCRAQLNSILKPHT